jgi:hypothetical protein
LLSQVYNLNFGLLNVEDVYDDDLPEEFLAIPYKAAKKPLKGSQFTSIEITIGFTIISFLINGLRNHDIEVTLKHLVQKYKNGGKHRNKLSEKKFYDDNFKNYMIGKAELRTIPNFINIENINAIKHNKNIIIYYLTTIMFPEYCREYVKQYNISYYDIMSGLLIKNNSGLTGTPFVHLIEHESRENLSERYIEKIIFDKSSND